MIIVRRKNKLHIDSAEDLYGESYTVCCHLLTHTSRFFMSCMSFYRLDFVLFQLICSTVQLGDRTVAAVVLLTPSMVVFGVMAPLLLVVCTRALATGRFNSPVRHLLFTL